MYGTECTAQGVRHRVYGTECTAQSVRYRVESSLIDLSVQHRDCGFSCSVHFIQVVLYSFTKSSNICLAWTHQVLHYMVAIVV